MNRRTYLAVAGAVALGGCAGGGSDDEDTPTDTEDEPDQTDESTAISVDTIDDFEDLSAWEVVAGSLEADTEQAATGSQSARLTVGSGESQARIVREFDSTVDFSDRHPGLAVTAGQTVDPVLQLIDDDGDRIDFRQEVHGDLPFERTDFGIDTVEGEPDLSAISEVQIALWQGDGTEGSLWVDDLHAVPRPETGHVMLSFEGGYETVYTAAAPVLEEHDLPAVAFVPTARIRESDEAEGTRLTEDQVSDLDEAGWTIASHTARSAVLTDLTADEQREDFEMAHEWLEDNGYEDGARYVAYPASAYNATSLDLAGEVHELGFAGRYPVHGAMTAPMRVSRVSNPSVEQAQEALELTASLGGVTTLSFFELADGASMTALEETAAMLADHEDAGDLEVVLPGDLEELVV